MKIFIWGLFFLLGFWALAWGADSKLLFEGHDLRTAGDSREKVRWQVEPSSFGVVLFLSMRCPNSHAHLEEVKKIARQYPEFRFVGIHSNADEPVREAGDYFKKHVLPFPILWDEGARIADDLRALKTPHAFVLNAHGKILYQGGVTDSADPARAKRFYLRDALRDLKNGRTVQTPEGRTLGCRMVREKEKKNEW